MFKRSVLDYLLLTVACFIFAVCWECFMIPNGMSAGGMMGLATLIQFATGGIIKAQYTYLALNALLIAIATVVMGIGFGFKTIYCIVMSSLAMQLLSGMPQLHSTAGEFLFVRETVLIPVIAGTFEAVGIGLVIRYGGSTGGTDIIAVMINKYWPVSLSTVFLISDLLICSLLLLLPEKNFSDMCYGLEELVTFSLMIDVVVSGRRSTYQLMVFSEKYGLIADHINQTMDRGATVLKARGWFTKQEKDVLMTIISQKELPGLTRVIRETDPKAFISVSPTKSVYGEGFEEIKAGLKKQKKNDN